ncbi:unnamed protein product [Sympodiomycopsis kandeliae]
MSQDTNTSRSSGSKDRLSVGSRVTIAQDCDLRGEISIASGTVIHPKCSVLATNGPIEIGQNCIIEETAVIINRRRETLRIGSENLFEVGCRIEARSIGDHNTFEARCKVPSNIAIGSFCTVSARSTVLPRSDWSSSSADGNTGTGLASHEDLDALLNDETLDETMQDARVGIESHQRADTATSATLTIPEESEEEASEVADSDGNAEAGRRVDDPSHFETIPDNTIIFAGGTQRKKWSGQGTVQMQALHAQHLDYLREAIPRVHKLKKII